MHIQTSTQHRRVLEKKNTHIMRPIPIFFCVASVGNGYGRYGRQISLMNKDTRFMQAYRIGEAP